ncbi:hypothetical protein K440DRAFT_639427 [Wilcoxina mikolae CBS 423.85]|nr:hypothetical protein K440DRAFT_639427 [Wilcoxina mikolae CBS 423.85]
MMQMTARYGLGGANSGGRGVFSKSHLKQHQPPLFTGNLKLETVNLFLGKVKHWVRQGGVAMGTTESDKRIDSAWQFMDPEAYSWFAHWIHQQGVTIIPPANGSYVPVMWPLFESAFHHRFVPEVAFTAVRKEIRVLRYSKAAGDVPYFNNIADQIIASAHMQKKLQPDTPFTLADAIEMVGKFSKRTTSHPATPATPVHHGASIAPPNAATVPRPAGLEPMDLTVANTNTRCYHCTGFGYEACDCATPNTCGHCGGPEASARSAAGSTNNVQEIAGDDVSVNDYGDDSAVEEEVLNKEDGQGNGNWE